MVSYIFWSLDLLEGIQWIAFYVVLFVLAFSFSSLHFHFRPCIFIKLSKNVKTCLWLYHFVSYEYFRTVIRHDLNFEHFKNLDDLDTLKSFDHWVFWRFWELTSNFRSILSSDLGLNSFESCYVSNLRQ